jgi:hypothetical protein
MMGKVKNINQAAAMQDLRISWKIFTAVFLFGVDEK